MPPQRTGLDKVGSYAAKAGVNKFSNYSKYTVTASEGYGDSCRNFTHPENSSPDCPALVPLTDLTSFLPR
jgi:hypothetical protein